MNSLSLSHNQILSEYKSCHSLGELFKKLETELFEKGQVICQFRVNGMNLTEDDEKRLADSPLGEVEILEIGFQSPEILIGGALESWCRDLPFLVQHADEMSSLFRFNKMAGNLKEFVQLIDECQMLVDSLIAISSLMSRHPLVSGECWKKNEALTAQAIGEALQSFEKKDFTRLADTLEYDIGHSLQTWLEILTEVKDTVKDTVNATNDNTGKNITSCVVGGKSSDSKD